MANNQVINVDLRASLSGMDKIVGQMKAGFKDAGMALGDKSEIGKLFKAYEKEYENLNRLTKNGNVNFVDSKAALASGQKVLDLYDKLQDKLGNIGNMSMKEMKSLFPDSFNKNIEQATKDVDSFLKQLDKIQTAQINFDKANNELKGLQTELENLRLSKTKEQLQADLKDINNIFNGIGSKASNQRITEAYNQELDQLRTKIQSTQQYLEQHSEITPNLKFNFGTIDNQIKEAKDKIAQLQQQSKDLSDSYDKRLSLATAQYVTDKGKANETTRFNAAEDEKRLKIAQEIKNLEVEINNLQERRQAQKDVNQASIDNTQAKAQLEEMLQANDKYLFKLKERITAERDAAKNANDTGKVRSLNNDIKALDEMIKKYRELSEQQKNAKTASQKNKAEESLTSDIEKQTEKVEKLKTALESIKSANSYDDLFKKLNDLGVNTEGIDKTAAGLNKIKEALSNADSNAYQSLVQHFTQMGLNAEQAANAVQQLRGDIDNLGAGSAHVQELNQQFQQLSSRLTYFFGLNNMINLFKRGIQDAISTVKELDAAMTNIAVVSKFSVSDMWGQLPQFTSVANELGTSISQVYEATTLYVQQGLELDNALGVATETMKMARIAGLEAADATDAMTAAIRGFNMEVNSMSAERVNDVYSKLAAITASDTEEISTAMTKTASLAHNANMEFENTAAFLAQIIETTRESAETAGTALKTVIARFTEMKKDPKGLIDVEGETVDVNKVETALRSIGVALRDTKGEFRNLDQVFLDISAKWNTLSTNQQRYIATMAAGSRQQSRFIAMMSDYDRTLELVNAAHNATGASNIQFEKTMESLEAKLNKLKNAWDEFAMGIANSTLIKAGVDGLTNILTLINDITGAFGNGVGGVLKFAAALAGLQAAGVAVKAGIGAIAGAMLGGTAGASGTILGGLAAGAPTSAGGLFKQMGTAAAMPFMGFGRLASGGFKKAKDFFLGADNRELTPWRERSRDFSPLSYAEEQLLISNEQDPDEISNRLRGHHSGYSKLASKNASSWLGTKLTGAGLSEGTALAATIGIYTAAIAGLAVAIKAAYDASPKGQLKIAEKLADTVAKSANIAKTQSEAFNKAAKNYNEANQAVENATSSYDRMQATSAANEAALQLAENPNLAAGLKYQDGRLQIDQSAIEAETKRLAEVAQQAAVASTFSQANVALKQGQVYSSQAERVAVRNYNSRDLENLSLNNDIRGLGLLAARDAQNSKAQALAAQGYSEMLTGAIKDSKVRDAAAKALGANFDGWSNKELRQARREVGGGLNGFWNKDALRQQYAAEFGKEADSSMKAKDIAQALASLTLEKKENEKADKLADLAKDKDVQALLNLFNGDVSYKDLNKVIGQAKKGFGKDEKFFSDLFGVDSADQFFADTTAQLQQKVTNMLTNIAYHIRQNSIGSTNAESLAKSLGLDGVSIVDSILTDFSNSNAGEALHKGLLNYIGFSDLSNDVLKGELESLNKLDLSSLPAQFVNLARASEDATSGCQALAAELLEIGKSEGLFTKQNLLIETLTSDGYGQLTDQVKAFIEENGRLTPDNIYSLADSCDELYYLIEDDILSVETLATALTYIEEGGDFNGLTERVLNALDAVTNLQGALSNLDGFIGGLEGKRSSTDRLGDIQKYFKTSVLPEFDNYMYGNENVQDAFEKIFENGNDLYWQAAEELDAGKTTTFDNVGKFFNKMFGKDATPQSMLQYGLGYGKQGVYNITDLDPDAESYDTKQWISAIKERVGAEHGLEINDDIATMLLGALTDKEVGLRENIRKNDYNSAIDHFVDEIIGTNQYEVSDAEIDAIASQFEDKDRQSVFDTINAKLKERADSSDDSTIQPEITIGDPKIEDSSGDPTLSYLTHTLSRHLKEALEQGDTEVKIDDIKAQVEEISADFPNIDKNKLIEQITQQLTGEGFTLTDTVTVQIPQINAETGNVEMVDIDFTAAGNSLDQLKSAVDAINASAQASSIASSMFSGLDAPLSQIQQIKSSIDSIPTSKTVTIYVTEVKTGGTVASGGIVKSYANGRNLHNSAANKLSPGIALTGEEKPEIVWNPQQGYAYITGTNGPQFTKLNAGDRVFNGQETADILRRSKTQPVSNSMLSGGKVYDSYISGRWGSTSASASSSGKSSKSSGSKAVTTKNEKEWENPYDWLYNLTEKINEAIKDRNALEKKYSQLVDSSAGSAQQLYDNLLKQTSLLEHQRDLESEMLEKRKQEMQEFVNANSALQQYASYDWENETIKINWDLIDAVKNTGEGERIEKYIDKLEKIQSEIDKAEKSLIDIDDDLIELQNKTREAYIDLEDRVITSLVKERQEEIDALEELNDSISEANSKLLQTLQKNLELQRRDRDNQRTEESIADKQARLAYLQQDTSGANAAEIRRLQKEIADMQEDYTDTLIDQKINDLEAQNDYAAEQRERQIDLQQAILDEAERLGYFNERAYQIIDQGLTKTGTLDANSQLTTLLAKFEEYEGMSNSERQKWLEDLKKAAMESGVWINKENQIEKLGEIIGETINFDFVSSTGEIRRLTGEVQKNGSVKVGSDYYDDVFKRADGTYQSYIGPSGGTAVDLEAEAKVTEMNNTLKDIDKTVKEATSNLDKTLATSSFSNMIPVTILTQNGSQSASMSIEEIREFLSRKGLSMANGGKVQNSGNTLVGELGEEMVVDPSTGRWYTVGKNGAEFTKLPTNAIVFNHRQTKQLLSGGSINSRGKALASGDTDLLSNILNNKSEITTSIRNLMKDLAEQLGNNQGNNYYDINIQVDSLSSDYDVEQLVTKIKKEITKDATYRNVNVINRLR